jgi:hypothetical protein
LADGSTHENGGANLSTSTCTTSTTSIFPIFHKLFCFRLKYIVTCAICKAASIKCCQDHLQPATGTPRRGYYVSTSVCSQQIAPDSIRVTMVLLLAIPCIVLTGFFSMPIWSSVTGLSVSSGSAPQICFGSIQLLITCVGVPCAML